MLHKLPSYHLYLIQTLPYDYEKSKSHLGAVNYAKESNLRINNDNLAKERLYYYNLYAKNYYFRNALNLF
jgi:hypothetical protein